MTNEQRRISELEAALKDAEVVISEAHDLLIGLARYHTRLKDLSVELLTEAEDCEPDSRDKANLTKRAERHLDQAAAVRWMVKSCDSLVKHIFGTTPQIEEIATQAGVDEDCELLNTIAMAKYVNETRLKIIDTLKGIGKLGVATNAFRERRVAQSQT